MKRFAELLRIMWAALLFLFPVITFSQELISITCTSCNGTGVMICPACHGQGGAYFGNAIAGYSFMPCFSCGGAKSYKCTMCAGKGSQKVVEPNPNCTNNIFNHAQYGACSMCWVKMSPAPYSGGYVGGGYSGGGYSGGGYSGGSNSNGNYNSGSRSSSRDCGTCLGTRTCNNCGGKGRRVLLGTGSGSVKCSNCGGTGKCPWCNGTGKAR